ncbi:MAG TPA: LysR family transcriptional regulator [Burkholderiaceae bacterium]|nr:LysR family transcriptional regulator [Burkholderiaceae bacterium]
MKLTLESLLLVDAIARRGSFAAAAEELGRVPSAVTYAARRLEGDLDALLFDRAGYRARLTPAGEELLREGRHLLAAADDLARRVQRVAAGWEQELRIALDTIIPFERFVPLLDRFCDLAPTQVRITEEVLGGTWDALLGGRADIAIGASQEGPEPHRLSIGYRSEPLDTVDLVFAVAPSHPLAGLPSPLPHAEIRRHRQIVVGDTSQELTPRATGLVGAANVLTVPTMAAKIQAQVAGLGCGYLPRLRIVDALARGELVVKETDQGTRQSALSFAWRQDARGKAVAWWIETLRNSATRAALAAGP